MDFECSTVCPVLLGLMGIGQKWLDGGTPKSKLTQPRSYLDESPCNQEALVNSQLGVTPTAVIRCCRRKKGDVKDVFSFINGEKTDVEEEISNSGTTRLVEAEKKMKLKRSGVGVYSTLGARLTSALPRCRLPRLSSRPPPSWRSQGCRSSSRYLQ